MAYVCLTRSVSEDEKPQILSDEEMNKLGAKIVKAELMGNKVCRTRVLSVLNVLLYVQTEALRVETSTNKERSLFKASGSPEAFR